MDDFELELKNAFLEEASQLLSDTEQCFLSLEHSPNDSSLIDKIFRLAHNLKGSSKAVGFDQMGAFAHQFENLLLKIKNGEIAVSSAIIGLLLRCNDHIIQMVDGLKANPGADFDSSELHDTIQSALDGQFVESSTATEDAQSFSEAERLGVPSADAFQEDEPVVAVSESGASVEHTLSAGESADSSDDVDESYIEDVQSHILTQIPEVLPREEIEAALSELVDQLHNSQPLDLLADDKPNVVQLPPKVEDSAPSAQISATAPAAQSAGATVTPINAASKPSGSSGQPPAGGKAATPVNDESIRVSLARLEKLLNFVGEIVILQTVLREQTAQSSAFIRKTVSQLSKVTKEVQDLSMSLRMVPLKQTFQKMQRIVRDTTGALNKKVNLIIQGEETEVDKTVLENLNDPLVHLVRNACDHGIESLEKRLASGKSEIGTIVLNAYHQSGKLVIEVKDDGGGINADIIRANAIEKKIIRPNQELSHQETLQLIFAPGFSTKAEVTDVSGRGVGMDVVKTNIENMQGEVLIETEVGKGTTFKVVLPLTLAIIDAMVIESEGFRFVIPLSHVHESVQTSEKEVQNSTLLGEVLLLRGENLPLYRLPALLGKKTNFENKNGIGLVIRSGDQPFAVMVDDILGQHQVVVKKLGDEVSNLKGFSGSAILGDGRPALILELSELAQSNTNKSRDMMKRGA